MCLRPGLITGAADDDPSGIATYSQVGAQFGLGMLWTMLFSFPLMAAMQEICKKIGLIFGNWYCFGGLRFYRYLGHVIRAAGMLTRILYAAQSRTCVISQAGKWVLLACG